MAFSVRHYIGQIKSAEWLKTGFIIGSFGRKEADARCKYRSFVEEMIGTDYQNPTIKAFGASILGRPDFVEEISTEHVRGKQDSNIPALRHFIERPSPEQITDESRAVFTGDEMLARRVSMYLCHKYSGMRLQEIGAFFSVRDTAISEASRRFVRTLEPDRELRKKVEGIKKRLISV